MVHPVASRHICGLRDWPEYDHQTLTGNFGGFGHNPAFIETVPKRGYRFIAPVSTTDAGPDFS